MIHQQHITNTINYTIKRYVATHDNTANNNKYTNT